MESNITDEEARNVIECMITNIVGEFADREMTKGAKNAYDALEKAKEALEKQIPKKPENETYFTNYKNQKKCPLCSDWVILPHDTKMKFCCTCGQAIDWSGDDY